MTFLPQKPHIYPHGARYIIQAWEDFLFLSNVPLPTSCMSESFTILFCVSYLWAVLLLSYWGGSGSFITDPSLISALICMLHWTPHKESCSAGGRDELFCCVRGRVMALLLFFLFFPRPCLTTIHTQFSRHWQSIHNTHAAHTSPLGISFSLGKSPLWAL